MLHRWRNVALAQAEEQRHLQPCGIFGDNARSDRLLGEHGRQWNRTGIVGHQ
ncbi:hypothetical protein D3C84_1218180 [compost metagenome]